MANKLGLADPEAIAEAELILLGELYAYVFDEAFPDRTLSVNDLFEWHRLWLGNLYDWAGRVRTVNLSKGDFMFAAAHRVPALLDEFERDVLRPATPCVGDNDDGLIARIAQVHIELILIHPFREGNGRLARLLADVMAVQGGFEPLDYTAWDADKPSYFAAIRSGLGGDTAPMQRLVRVALEA